MLPHWSRGKLVDSLDSFPGSCCEWWEGGGGGGGQKPPARCYDFNENRDK